MMQIQIHGGVLVALVDDEDYPLLNRRKWFADDRGYPVANMSATEGKTRMRMHQLVIPAHHGLVVDHINRDRLDNRKENLRLVTRQMNNMNVGKRSTTQPYKGVRRKGTRWLARIDATHLGSFATAEEAAAAYDKAATELYGECAYRNLGVANGS